jgi:hypothetical protein
MSGHPLRFPATLLALLALCVSACGVASGSAMDLPDGSSARRWGDGPYGVVLVHDAQHDPGSWDAQARVFAEHGMTVVAVESVATDAVAGAITALRDAGVERVALLAAGSGTDVAIVLGESQPDLVDQLILLSASADVRSLGVFPKLFVASEGDRSADARRMADEAPGDWNALYLAPGEASGQDLFSGEGSDATLDAILQRLEERR